MNTPVLRIGILGAAKIARAFVTAVNESPVVKVTGIASRDPAKSASFAHEFGIERHYPSYEALLADREVDAVYNPLPNSLHADWSMRAARAGKHVLCEKPLAASASEARMMFATAAEHGVHLVEGYPYRAQPHALKLSEWVNTGVLGQVQHIQASFGFTMADISNIRLDPTLAGGALMDAGAYPVSLMHMVAKRRPTRVHAVARWAESGVDRTLVATAEFEGELLAQISCSFSTAVHRHALIVGTEAVVQTTYLNHTPADRPAVLLLKKGGAAWNMDYETIAVPGVNGFLAEAESFARLVQGGADFWTGVSPEESIDIALTLDAMRLSARTGKSVEVADVDRS